MIMRAVGVLYGNLLGAQRALASAAALQAELRPAADAPTASTPADAVAAAAPLLPAISSDKKPFFN